MRASDVAVAFAILLAIGQPTAAAYGTGRRLVSLSSATHPNNERSTSAAAVYLDNIFANYTAARASLNGDFVKRSKIAVVYICHDRKDVIKATLDSVLMSEDITLFDVIVSQDGGSNYVVQNDGLQFINSHYLRHPVNLLPGQHHYFVKRFVFEVMGYEALIVVEEDNKLHPQALQMLYLMLQLSRDDHEVGLVAITDMDNSLLVDEGRFSSALLRPAVGQGHLWVYGMHVSRYGAVRQHLLDYYNVINGRDIKSKDASPLRDDITRLHATKGFPKDIPLSQDAYLVHALAVEGYTRRLTTLVRLFDPLGWQGLHFHQDQTVFAGVYGKGMYEGEIIGAPFEVTKNREAMLAIEADCRERLDRVYQQYLGRQADEGASNTAVVRLLTGKLNAVELVRNVISSTERRRRMKEFVTSKRSAKRLLLARGEGRRLRW